jgi:perosamine synthetase
MDRLHALARRHGLHVIEDAAHALPVDYQGKRIGAISEFTAFSFYATKTLTTGEGGMLTTNDDGYAQQASMMRLHGIGGDAWKRYSRTGSWYYEVQEAGYKLNLCDLLAALGRVQLRRCDDFWKARCQIAAAYNQAFSQIEELQLPPVGEEATQHAWHLYILRLRDETLSIDREQFIEELKAAGIGTSVHFIPLHLHPYYARTYGYRQHDFPHAEDAYSRCFSLPIYPDLSAAEMERVIQSVQQVVQANRKRKLVSCGS